MYNARLLDKEQKPNHRTLYIDMLYIVNSTTERVHRQRPAVGFEEEVDQTV